jgi:ligand-binding sensor domain-containing protein
MLLFIAIEILTNKKGMTNYMNAYNSRKLSAVFLMLVVSSILSCYSQTNTKNKKIKEQSQTEAPQIDEYVVEIFEDSKKNLWFGTIYNGAAKYDGKSLTYLTIENGLIGNTVTSFAEDKQGNIWLGTHSGLSKFDGKTFVNFTDVNGLVDNTVSELLIDKNGILWVGTWNGVSQFNGTTFSTFALPNPEVELMPYQSTKHWISEIIEDKQGNIWFSRDGYGVCKYDGHLFKQFTKKEGLVSNNVQEIIEDKNGNIWFGSRVVERDNTDTTKRSGEGGLSMFDGKTFTHFPDIKGLSKNEVYAIFEDSKGNIWIGANRLGLYRYDGKDFTLFSKTDRADLMTYGYGIQSLLEDYKGNIWLGLSGGLFRLKGDSIINVTRNGPWD